MSRRMFSDDIVGSDAFIEMPISAQLLYFHLGMRADDDGFVNPNITMRMVNAGADDLKILVVKRFLLRFDNGVVVVKHWRLNNFIRKDRYKETNYLDEKNTLRVKENQSYTLDQNQGKPLADVPWKSDFDMRLPSGQPLVNAGKDRIGKDNRETGVSSLSFLDKISKETIEEMIERFRCDEAEVKTKAKRLADYCRAKGKKYKDYKAFLRNALRKDFGERPPRRKVEIVNGVVRVTEPE